MIKNKNIALDAAIQMSKIAGPGQVGKVFWLASIASAEYELLDKSIGSGYLFTTMTHALAAMTANQGDVLYVAPNYVETIASAADVAIAKAGISIYCLGSGAVRPTFTFSATASTITVTAASVVFKNFIVVPSVDNVVSPIVVSAADCDIKFEAREADATTQFTSDFLTTAAADRLKLKVRHIGFIAGVGCVNAIRLVGVDTADIEIDFYGVASTAVVEFHTTACLNIKVDGAFYNNGSASNKNIVDTVGGSSWKVKSWEGSSLLGTPVNRALATLPQGAAGALFTITGGKVLITSIVGEVTTIIQATANATKLVANPTTGTSVDMCATLDVTADEVGCLYGITGTPAGALVGTDAGLATTMATKGIIVNTGTIDLDCAGSATGAVKWVLHYIPIDVGAHIVAA